MKELKRNEEGVSPVIATILMVAITVVLAATLYMMVGDIGGDDTQPLAGSLTHDEGTTFEIVSLQTPSSANPDNVEIIVLSPDGTQLNNASQKLTDGWSLLDDGDVVGGSRFDVSNFNMDESEDSGDGEGDVISESHIGEVVVRIDGYTGTLNYEM